MRRKYKQQMRHSASQYPELRDLLRDSSSTEDAVLRYLNWRVADVIPPEQAGSQAVYVLYYPIPNEPDIVRFVRQNRQFATQDYVLLSAAVDDTLYPVGESLNETQQTDRSFWVRQWRAQMPGRENDLWFDGIPHAFLIPPNGRIVPEHLRVEQQMFH